MKLGKHEGGHNSAPFGEIDLDCGACVAVWPGLRAACPPSTRKSIDRAWAAATGRTIDDLEQARTQPSDPFLEPAETVPGQLDLFE